MKNSTITTFLLSISSIIHTDSVTLVAITPHAEETIGYIARVSNPANQANKAIAKLLKYCIDNQHWSIFEQAFMTVEITTSRAISMQLLRHRTFTFQQFSQRYADNSLICEEIPLPELRTQDHKNRQNSVNNLTEEEIAFWHGKIQNIFSQTMDLYQSMLAAGIAKECARFILPEIMPTKLYMSGSIRSWIHYIQLRTANGTQKEHMEIAEMIKKVFIQHLPTISEALCWID